MQTISITHARTADLAVEAIHQRPILVQFPTVFVLLAAPTATGAAQLDALKTRLSGKNYGTAIGSLRKFIAQASRTNLPREFNRAGHYRPLNGSFIRLPFRDRQFQSTTIRNGTHQGLLLPPGPFVQLFKRIESSFESYAPEAIWNGRNYCALLCTSCNVSGDPDGSIVAYDKAVAFAEARNIGLFITTSRPSAERGSYPILGFERDQVNIHREGPGLDNLKTKIPAKLVNW